MLDLMEPLRPVVDRRVLEFVQAHAFHPADFTIRSDGVCSHLLDKQAGRCAISGLSLQFDGSCDDLELLCSLDRVDSNGHYVLGNLQLVCPFVNRWKAAQTDSEFRRLLTLLRATSV